MEDSENTARPLVRELGSTSLISIIQPILKSGARAHLHVEIGFENGDFYFDAGRMVHAASSAIKGQEAAYHLISYRSGAFALRKVKSVPEYTVDIDWLDFQRFYEEEIEKIVLAFLPEIEGGLYLEMRDQHGNKTFVSDRLSESPPKNEMDSLLNDPEIKKSYPALQGAGRKALRIKTATHLLMMSFLPEIRHFTLTVFADPAQEAKCEKWLGDVFEPKALEAVSIALEIADKKRVRGKVLVIDDSPTTRAILEDTLSEYKFKVITASDGYEGLITAKDERPDMIFLDVMMPKMDGYETLKRLRKDDELKNLPIVMLTSKGLAADKGEAFKEGANLYIEKPFTSKKILAIVENVLGLD